MEIGFYAGSFDPFTNGHLHVAKQSARLFDKVVIGIGVNPKKRRRFNQQTMKEAIENLIHEISPAIELDDPDLNLAEDMDSLDLISLLTELEDLFGIEITMEEKTEANFRNVDTLIEMIERLK